MRHFIEMNYNVRFVWHYELNTHKTKRTKAQIFYNQINAIHILPSVFWLWALEIHLNQKLFLKKSACYCRLCRTVRIDCKFLLACLIATANEDCWICISDQSPDNWPLVYPQTIPGNTWVWYKFSGCGAMSIFLEKREQIFKRVHVIIATKVNLCTLWFNYQTY